MEISLCKFKVCNEIINWFLNTCRAPAPHLDYFQGNEERREFYQTYPLPVIFGSNKNEPNALMGTLDTEDYKYEVMLGVWKPLYPTKVSNFCLTKFDLE